MEQLRKAIGPMDKLAICTDACKGLESAVRIVFPQAEKRECFRHLMENMKKYYSCNTPGVIVLINLPCHHNALQSIPVRLTLLCIN
jgi:hypothetical protein